MKILFPIAIAIVVTFSSALGKHCMPDKFSATKLEDDRYKESMIMDFTKSLIYSKSKDGTSIMDDENGLLYTLDDNGDCAYQRDRKSDIRQCIPDGAKKLDNPPEFKDTKGVTTWFYKGKDNWDTATDYTVTVNEHFMPLKEIRFHPNIGGHNKYTYNLKWTDISIGKIDEKKLNLPALDTCEDSTDF